MGNFEAMKRTLNLSIPTPCTEKWESFEPRPTGGFCGTCCKTVVDLTRMSDDQVIDFFRNKPAHACGRLRPDQLRTYAWADPVRINPGFSLFRAGLLSLFLMLAGKTASAQQVIVKPATVAVQDTETAKIGKVRIRPDGYIIKGIVRDKDEKSLLPGVIITLRGTEESTYTDADGRFSFPRELYPGDVLLVSFIGYETQVYVVPKEYKDAEVIFMMPMEMLTGTVAVTEIYAEPSGIHKWWSKIKSFF